MNKAGLLEISGVLIRNFQSYGDYDTYIQLDDLGSCLITGRTYCDNLFGADDDTNNSGAGKSGIVDAILWCLFGRTVRLARPGDDIVNWYTKKDCIVKLFFKNGDTLTRTRGSHNDLILKRNGEDVSLGTTTMEQSRLNKELNLDWDIFCGATFFSQFGKSWMERSDIKRKEAMEREFHLDRIILYAGAAKERHDKVLLEQRGLNASLEATQSELASITSQIEQFQDASDKFDENKKLQVARAKQTLQSLIASRDSIQLYDIDVLEKQWQLLNDVKQKIEAQETIVQALERDRRNTKADINYKDVLINKWRNKGTVCPSCEQGLSVDYINTKIVTPEQEMEQLASQLIQLDLAINTKRELLNKIQTQLDKRKPNATVSEAKENKREWMRRDAAVQRQQDQIDSMDSEVNQYGETITKLSAQCVELAQKIEKLQGQISRLNDLLLHLSYIHKAYHDRRKIKSYILAENIPYLNERIGYYLKRFGLDLSIEFTNALGAKSNSWRYELFSGGESKRLDVAMMLAMFDLHNIMYGRQSNIIVLDEVDGRLDRRSAEIFADIIRTDFASRVDSVLVISQRIDMRGVFSSEIKVVRDADRFSHITEVIK